MKLWCWGKLCPSRKIHPHRNPVSYDLEHIIIEHHEFLMSCLFGKQSLITGEMIHKITERSARFTALLTSASLDSTNTFVEEYEKEFTRLERRIYDELKRMFRAGTIRFTSDALQLIFLQNHIGFQQKRRTGSALF